MKIRNRVTEGVKDSIMVQMAELQDWGIMADWRHSYFTLMPQYQAMVLRQFAALIRKKLIYRGSRPVFWSVGKQRVLGEEEMQSESEVIDTMILMAPITRFA